MAYNLNYSDGDDTRMDEDAPPPARSSHSHSTSQRIEPYPRGVYDHAGGYGSYPPSYSYYSHQHQQQPHQHGQNHQHTRAVPPPLGLVSRAYVDATGTSAAYLNHQHWAAQQAFGGAADGSTAPTHHSQSLRPPVLLAPAPVGGRSGSGPVAGGGLTGARRRSSHVEMVLSPPMSPTSVKSEDANNSSYRVRDAGASGMQVTANGNPIDSLKRFQCMQPGCEAAFARKADRDRHHACVHEKSENKKFACPETNCSRTGQSAFTRKDHLMEHLRNYHHHDIPKKKRVKDDRDPSMWIKEERM